MGAKNKKILRLRKKFGVKGRKMGAIIKFLPLNPCTFVKFSYKKLQKRKILVKNLAQSRKN
jgi:hypothetical protein